MAYCTIADVRLNLDGFDTATISDANITSFINKADSYINSILAISYTLPFTATIPLLTSVSTDLTCYYVLRRNYTRDSIETSDWVEQFKKDADDILDKLKENKIDLVGSDNIIIAFGSELIQHNNEGYTPTFDIGDPLAWRNDPDRIETIEDNK